MTNDNDESQMFPQSLIHFMFLTSVTSEFINFCEKTEMDREWHCRLTVPWTHSRGPWAPCGKACHSGSGWRCLCGRSSWSSQAHAPAEAHQRCLTRESPHRSASLVAECQGSDRQTERQTDRHAYSQRREQEGYSKEVLTERAFALTVWLWKSTATVFLFDL